MKLVEIDTRSGKLVIGRPGDFPQALLMADDAPQGRAGIESLWRHPDQVGSLRRQWQALFPGTVISRRSDGDLRRQLETALRGHRLRSLFLRHAPPLEAAPPDADRARIMHIELSGKTVLLAQKGALPLRMEPGEDASDEVGAKLRQMQPADPARHEIGRQARRVLSPGSAAAPRAALGRELAMQLRSGRVVASVLDQPHLVAQAARLPSAPRPIDQWTTKEKIYEALARSYDLCGRDLRAALDRLLQPRNLALMVGFLLVLAGLQFIPGVDVVVDFGMLVWLLYTVGTRSVEGVKELIKAVTAAAAARDERELNEAARHFATAFEALGEAGISALLAFLQGLRFASRFAKAGEAEGEAAVSGREAAQSNSTARAGPRPSTEAPEGSKTQTLSHAEPPKRPAFSGDWNNYKTLGLNQAPLESAEGRALVKYYESMGLDRAEAIDRAAELIKSGSTLPTAGSFSVGDKFYKLVPKGGAVGPKSPYWMTESELNSLKGLSPDQIGERLGLPLAQQSGGFDVYAIEASAPSTSFSSVVAPTEELGANGMMWKQAGGATQTLLPDRSLFSAPSPVNIPGF